MDLFILYAEGAVWMDCFISGQCKWEELHCDYSMLPETRGSDPQIQIV